MWTFDLASWSIGPRTAVGRGIGDQQNWKGDHFGGTAAPQINLAPLPPPESRYQPLVERHNSFSRPPFLPAAGSRHPSSSTTHSTTGLNVPTLGSFARGSPDRPARHGLFGESAAATAAADRKLLCMATTTTSRWTRSTTPPIRVWSADLSVPSSAEHDSVQQYAENFVLPTSSHALILVGFWSTNRPDVQTETSPTELHPSR